MLMKNINNMNSGTMDGDGSVKNSEMLLVEKIPASKTSILMTKICISTIVHMKLPHLQQEISPFLFHGRS
jgi:hypothetical protein